MKLCDELEYVWPKHDYATQALYCLTLTLLLELLSAYFLICLNSKYFNVFKVDKNVVVVSNSFDQVETPRCLASHPDPSCLHMGLWSGSRVDITFFLFYRLTVLPVLT